jgi:hypothetical protein
MSLFLPVFEALNASGARYVTVGGFAVVLHGHLRLTADIDLVVDLEPDELRRTLQTLEELGLEPRAPVEAEDFADSDIRRVWIEEKGMQVFSLFDPSNPMVSVDLFVSYPLPFDDMYSRSEVIVVGGVDVRVASLSDLIDIKRAAGRPSDLQDVEALKEIRRVRGLE